MSCCFSKKNNEDHHSYFEIRDIHKSKRDIERRAFDWPFPRGIFEGEMIQGVAT